MSHPGPFRRPGRAAAILFPAALALAVPGVAPAQAPPRPNILWISAEDMSPDLGCYGEGYARTPNLDRLASQGARFTRAFAAAPVCAPSRSVIITGMYATSIGSLHMRSKAVPPPGVKAFPEYLRAAGYYCTNNAKTDYNFEAPPAHAPPATVWDDSSRKAHWRGRAPGQPFFAVFNLTVTHESRIRSSPEEFAKDTAALKPEDRHDPAGAGLPPYYPDTPAVRNDWARYHDLVTAMDLQGAAILRELEEDGLAASTVVFFWSDHGRGLPRAKRWVYDSGIHVPLIVRWPAKIAPGSVRDEPVSLIDLAPAVLSIAGLPVPAHFQGRNFLDVPAGAAPPAPREYIVAHRDRMDEAPDTIRAVRDRRYKYIRNFSPGRPYAQHIAYAEEMPTLKEMRRLHMEHWNALGPLFGKALDAVQLLYFRPEKPAEELYDTAADPHEVKDLAGLPEHAEALRRLRAELERWMRETGDLGLVPEEELRERLRPGGVWARVVEPEIEAAPPAAGTIKIILRSATEGASIAYTTEPGDDARWKLYAGELLLAPPVLLRARACRLGYLDSAEVARRFE